MKLALPICLLKEKILAEMKNWKPRGVLAWSLTVVGCLLAVLMVGLAYCMAYPVRWDGPGKFGAIALLYPLHLLVFTMAAAGLACLANRRPNRLPAWMFGFVAVLTVIMALSPTIVIWRKTRQMNVQLSPRVYLSNAVHVNNGFPKLERSVVYGTAKDGRLELDVWPTGLPNSGPLRPAIVFVHGGAFIHGNRSMLPDWDRWLNELGYEVFDVEYRMPPPARWQDEVGDIKAALGWVAAHATEYHVDRSRISIMGNSAGGNLAMLAAYSMGSTMLPPSIDVPPAAIRSVINLYGPCDIAMLYRSSPSRDYVQAAAKQYIGGTPEQYPERYRLVSPLYHISRQTPPTITILGTSDRLVPLDQAGMLDQAFANAGAVHEMYLLPGNDHGFDANWGGFGTQIARAKIRAFLQQYDGR
jgi:acetyl esterase/lipase